MSAPEPRTPKTPKTPRVKPASTDPRFFPAPEPQEKPVEKGTPRKQKTKYSSNPPIEHHVGWVIDSPRQRQRPHQPEAAYSPATLAVGSQQLSTSLGSLSSTPQSLPTFEHPSHALLKQNGFTQLVYHKYRSRCLKDRKRLGMSSLGSCPSASLITSSLTQVSVKVKRWTHCSDSGRSFWESTLTVKCTKSSDVWPTKTPFRATDTDSSASSGSTPMVSKTTSDKSCSTTSRLRPLRTSSQVCLYQSLLSLSVCLFSQHIPVLCSQSIQLLSVSKSQLDVWQRIEWYIKELV